MTTHNEAKISALEALTGSSSTNVTDLEHEWLDSVISTPAGSRLREKWMTFLGEQGFTGTYTEALAAFLADQGYTGTLDEALLAYWAAGGGGGSGATLAFHAFDTDENGEFFPDTLVATTSGTTEGNTTTRYYPDGPDGIYREYGSGEVGVQGSRVVKNILADADIDELTDVSNVTVTPGRPDHLGGTDAYRLQSTSTNAYCRENIAGSYIGRESRASVWVKANSAPGGAISFYGGSNAAGNTNIAPALNAAGNDVWIRVAADLETGISASTFVGFFFGQPGEDIEVAFMQYEDVTGQANQNPSEYAAPGSPRHLSYENGNTVSSNVVTEASGSDFSDPAYVVCQPALTNLQTYSNDQTNATWTATNMTVAQDATGMTGAANEACTLTATANNATVIAAALTSASAAHTTRWFIQRSVGTGTVEITTDNGSTWQDVTATVDGSDTWPECLEEQTLANPQIGIRLGTSGDAVIVGSAESFSASEAAVAGSSVIFTAGSTVTVNASDLTFDSANWQQPTEGVVYMEAMYPGEPAASNNFGLHQGTGSTDYLLLFRVNQTGTRYENTSAGLSSKLNILDPSLVANTAYKTGAAAHAASGEVISKLAGDTPTPAATNFANWSGSALRLNRSAGQTSQCLLFRNIQIWNGFTDFDEAEAKLDELLA